MMQFTVMAPNVWQGPWMNRQQLFSRIGQQHQVIYTNGMLSTWDLGKGAMKSAPWFYQEKMQDKVIVSKAAKWPMRVPSLAWLDNLALNHFAKTLGRHARANEPKCLYIFHPKFADYIDHFDYDLLVYHAYDDFSKQGNYQQQRRSQEQKLMMRADIVIASSTGIAQRLAELGEEKQVHVVPNGVDFEAFSAPCDEPADLANIARPRVGYTGSINQKVDLPLLSKLSLALPEHQFVMIGGEGVLGDQASLLAELKQRANIHFLGQKKVSEVAAYIQHMDVNTMLYKADKSTWAISGYPLKLHEYLATGKPAISAGIDAVYEFEQVLAIPNTEAEWVVAINQAISEASDNNAQATAIGLRQSVAAENTWDSRVEQILALLEPYIKNA